MGYFTHSILSIPDTKQITYHNTIQQAAKKKGILSFCSRTKSRKRRRSLHCCEKNNITARMSDDY